MATAQPMYEIYSTLGTRDKAPIDEKHSAQETWLERTTTGMLYNFLDSPHHTYYLSGTVKRLAMLHKGLLKNFQKIHGGAISLKMLATYGIFGRLASMLHLDKAASAFNQIVQ